MMMSETHSNSQGMNNMNQMYNTNDERNSVTTLNMNSTESKERAMIMKDDCISTANSKAVISETHEEHGRVHFTRAALDCRDNDDSKLTTAVDLNHDLQSSSSSSSLSSSSVSFPTPVCSIACISSNDSISPSHQCGHSSRTGLVARKSSARFIIHHPRPIPLKDDDAGEGVRTTKVSSVVSSLNRNDDDSTGITMIPMSMPLDKEHNHSNDDDQIRQQIKCELDLDSEVTTTESSRSFGKFNDATVVDQSAQRSRETMVKMEEDNEQGTLHESRYHVHSGPIAVETQPRMSDLSKDTVINNNNSMDQSSDYSNNNNSNHVSDHHQSGCSVHASQSMVLIKSEENNNIKTEEDPINEDSQVIISERVDIEDVNMKLDNDNEQVSRDPTKSTLSSSSETRRISNNNNNNNQYNGEQTAMPARVDDDDDDKDDDDAGSGMIINNSSIKSCSDSTAQISGFSLCHSRSQSGSQSEESCDSSSISIAITKQKNKNNNDDIKSTKSTKRKLNPSEDSSIALNKTQPVYPLHYHYHHHHHPPPPHLPPLPIPVVGSLINSSKKKKKNSNHHHRHRRSVINTKHSDQSSLILPNNNISDIPDVPSLTPRKPLPFRIDRSQLKSGPNGELYFTPTVAQQVSALTESTTITAAATVATVAPSIPHHHHPPAPPPAPPFVIHTSPFSEIKLSNSSSLPPPPVLSAVEPPVPILLSADSRPLFRRLPSVQDDPVLKILRAAEDLYRPSQQPSPAKIIEVGKNSRLMRASVSAPSSSASIDRRRNPSTIIRNAHHLPLPCSLPCLTKNTGMMAAEVRRKSNNAAVRGRKTRSPPLSGEEGRGSSSFDNSTNDGRGIPRVKRLKPSESSAVMLGDHHSHPRRDVSTKMTHPRRMIMDERTLQRVMLGKVIGGAALAVPNLDHHSGLVSTTMPVFCSSSSNHLSNADNTSLLKSMTTTTATKTNLATPSDGHSPQPPPAPPVRVVGPTMMKQEHSDKVAMTTGNSEMNSMSSKLAAHVNLGDTSLSKMAAKIGSLKASEDGAKKAAGVRNRRSRSHIVGASCHQCKNKKTWNHIIFCTKYKGSKDPRKIMTAGRKNGRCTQRFCKECLKKYYSQDFINRLMNEQKKLRSDAEAGILSFYKVWRGEYSGHWVCPFCENSCCCANCRRRKTEENGASVPTALPPVSDN